MIFLTLKIPSEGIDLAEGYDRLTALSRSLESTFPGESWYRLPLSDEDTGENWTPVHDRESFLRRAARDMEEAEAHIPGAGKHFAMLLTTASGGSAWELDEKTVLDYAPHHGLAMFKIHTAADSGRWTHLRLRELLVASCRELKALFAYSDHPKAPRPSGRPGETYYGTDYRVFPHREFLGWMGFVRERVNPDDIAEADEVTPLAEDGTLIVSVADAFDVHNPAHIHKAQRVEMRLADLGLLPFIDTRFIE